MDENAALRERTALIDNVFSFKHNKRVPICGNIFTWKYFDAGYNLKEALFDYEVLEKVNTEFHEIYQFDVYSDIGTRNPVRVTSPLGGGHTIIDEAGEAVSTDDFCLMERGEYSEFANDPTAFYWSTAFKRYCKPDITLRDFVASAKELAAFARYKDKMVKRYINEFGAMHYSLHTVGLPFENIMGLRGMRNVSIDIHKCKTEIKEAMDVLYTTKTEPVLKNAVTCDYTGFLAPIQFPLLGHTLLNVKQFETLYWPYFKRFIDTVIANNTRLFVFCEGTMERFVEFFQDIPKGVMLLHLEQDDIFEIRKKLPNIALAGGMPSALLGYSTKEQCVDYAKKLIDTLGDGYILSQDKMMSYRNDAKRENLLAVNDFVKSYSY